MENNIKKKIASICLGAVAALSLGVGVGIAANANVETQQEIMLPASGYIGDVFDLPQYAENGKDAKAVIVAPDGGVYSGNKIKLQTAGLYQILYQIDGKTVKTETCLCKYRAADFFTCNNFAETTGVSTYKYVAEPSFTGMKCKVSQGGEISFTQEIDVSEMTKEDKLIELLIEPNEQGVLDFGQVILTFSDVEDDSKFFQVIASDGHLDSSTSGGIAFVRAGANGQTAGGINYSGNKAAFQTVDIYGSPAPFTFRAEFFPGETRYDYGLNLYYDNAEKAIYLKNSINEHYGKKYLVADFDDVVTFGGSVWDGLVSDKVKLTVTFDRFQTESGNIIFKEINGIDFSAQEIIDEEPPTLFVDLQGESDAPNSVLGNSYSIFPAMAKDFYDGEIAVQSKVYYQNLAGDALYDVSITDGVFVTDKVGRYVMKYQATDRFGNTAVQEYDFYCFNKAEEIALSGTELGVSETELYTSVSVKSSNTVAAKGGNGRLQVTCEVIAPDGSKTELKNDAFLAEQIGEYSIVYTATDYFGVSKSKTEKVTVLPAEKPIFIHTPTLPEVLVAGFSYALPQAQAVECVDGKVVAAAVKTFVNGEEKAETFVAPASGSAIVEYRAYASESGEYQSISSVAPVVNGQNGKDQAAYFYSADGNVMASETRDAVELSFARDGSVAFSNTLNNKLFDLTAKYDLSSTKYANMRIVLADSASNVTVTLKIALSVSGATISAPNADSVPLETRDGFFAVRYKHENFVIQNLNNANCAVITTDDNGNPFNGFKGGVYAKFFFDGVYGASSLSLQSLNGQALGYRRENPELAKDSTGPVINVNGEYIYNQKVGQEMEVYTADAFDVLGQISSFTVTVRDPDGNVVLSGSPTQTHTFRLEKIGLYKIIYTATDSFGNAAPLAGASVMANDASKPTYTLNVKFDEYYRVGAGVKVPEVSVQDDYSAGYCDIFVELPTGEVRLVMHYVDEIKISYLTALNEIYPASFKVDENTFKLEMAGRYKVTFVFYDDSYNCAIQQYAFTAVK